MQKDRIYYMWLCYYMWRDWKINYFFCQQGWRPIVKIQLQISMNYSTKHCLGAKVAKSSYRYCKHGLHQQRDILTFTLLSLLSHTVCRLWSPEVSCITRQPLSQSHSKLLLSSTTLSRQARQESSHPSWRTPVVCAETHWLCCLW